MSDWLKFLQTQLAENPGKPLKEVIEIAKIEIKKIPEKKIKHTAKKNQSNLIKLINTFFSNFL